MNGVRSMRHSKRACASLENPKFTLAELVVLPCAGPATMLVSGGVTSIVHVYVSGVGSSLPDPSIARTRKVCEPPATPL